MLGKKINVYIVFNLFQVYFIKYKTQKDGVTSATGGSNLNTLGGTNTNILSLGNAPDTEQIPSGLGIGQQSSGSVTSCE